MPYKNPEDKRRWEREHREQRNVRRRAQRLASAIEPDPASVHQFRSNWTTAVGLAVGIAVAFLAALAGVSAGAGRVSPQR